jgi:hypothetical protein
MSSRSQRRWPPSSRGGERTPSAIAPGHSAPSESGQIDDVKHAAGQQICWQPLRRPFVLGQFRLQREALQRAAESLPQSWSCRNCSGGPAERGYRPGPELGQHAE